MSRRDAPLSPEIANAVYDVLVEHIGTPEGGREAFVSYETREHLSEYRIGALGFGGKFWRNRSFRPDGTFGEHWYVNNYAENATDKTRAAIAAAAPFLDALRAQHEAEQDSTDE